MATLCVNCKEREASSRGWTTTTTPPEGTPHLSITLSGFECTECAHKQIVDLYRKHSGSLVRAGWTRPLWPHDSEPWAEVNWARYVEISEPDSRSRECREANEVLLAIKVFSLRAEENWMHFSKQMLPMNPSEHTSTYFFFTNRSDATAYGAARGFGTKDRRWGGLYQIGEVLSSLPAAVTA